MLSSKTMLVKRTLAAPSWVIAGNLAANCQFLAGKVDEVGLLFLESAGCTAYSEKDIPLSLAALPLSYHVHLPTDLPGKNGRTDAEFCCQLMEKVWFLGAQKAVLHLPQNNAAAYLVSFVDTWRNKGHVPEDLLVENTKEQSLLSLADTINTTRVSLCLDTGHIFAYHQEALLAQPLFLEKTRMIHYSAPGENDKKSSHRPLTDLTPSELIACKQLLNAVSHETILMIELFQWSYFLRSLPLLKDWLHSKASVNSSL